MFSVTRWSPLGDVAVLLLATTLVASAAGATQSTAKDSNTYTWFGELVSLDNTALTVKARVAYPQAIAELKQFKPGERVWVMWSGVLDYSDAVRQILLKRAARAGLKSTLAEPVSPHGLRAGFVTTAYRNGVADEEIMGHTRHRSLTTMRSYVRRAKLSKDSPAGKLGL